MKEERKIRGNKRRKKD